jgi:hypothetical protein
VLLHDPKRRVSCAFGHVDRLDGREIEATLRWASNSPTPRDISGRVMRTPPRAHRGRRRRTRRGTIAPWTPGPSTRTRGPSLAAPLTSPGGRVLGVRRGAQLPKDQGPSTATIWGCCVMLGGPGGHGAGDRAPAPGSRFGLGGAPHRRHEPRREEPADAPWGPAIRTLRHARWRRTRSRRVSWPIAMPPPPGTRRSRQRAGGAEVHGPRAHLGLALSGVTGCPGARARDRRRGERASSPRRSSSPRTCGPSYRRWHACSTPVADPAGCGPRSQWRAGAAPDRRGPATHL